MRLLKILGGFCLSCLIVFVIAIVWSGLAADAMISNCHDNSAGEYISDYEARKAYCGEFGASTADKMPYGY